MEKLIFKQFWRRPHTLFDVYRNQFHVNGLVLHVNISVDPSLISFIIYLLKVHFINKNIKQQQIINTHWRIHTCNSSVWVSLWVVFYFVFNIRVPMLRTNLYVPVNRAPYLSHPLKRLFQQRHIKDTCVCILFATKS